MKRALILLSLLAAPLLRAQDPSPASLSEISENYKILKGRVDDLLDARNAQDKRLRDLQSKVDELQTKVGELTAQLGKRSGDYASKDDLIAEDKKRQADNEDILKTLKEIAKAGNTPVAPPPPHSTKLRTNVVDNTPTTSAQDGPGYDYVAVSGDNLTKISRKFFEKQNVKPTQNQLEALSNQILKANAFLKGDARNLKEGDKLFIPAPKTDGTASNK